jgi:hypothetical protein
MKTRILCSVTVFRKSCSLLDNAKKYFRAGQATDNNMAPEHYMQDTQGYKHTFRICNTYCFSACNNGCTDARHCYVIRTEPTCDVFNTLGKMKCEGALYSAFGKSLCTYKRCWKWCPRAYIQVWNRLILFANTFCRPEFGKSPCTYKRCWKWCPRAYIQ